MAPTTCSLASTEFKQRADEFNYALWDVLIRISEAEIGIRFLLI
jgi:hypothetical protein